MKMTMGSLFDGLYLITTDGRLYSCRTKKYLQPSTDKDGYLYYVVSINGKRRTLKAHRLVANAYIPNPYNKPTVDHKNGIRTDNRIENLRWATYKEQQQNEVTKEKLESLHRQTDYRAMGEKRNFGRKTTYVYEETGRLIGVYETLKDAAEANNVSQGKASECANGRKKAVRGLVFCYD